MKQGQSLLLENDASKAYRAMAKIVESLSRKFSMTFSNQEERRVENLFERMKLIDDEIDNEHSITDRKQKSDAIVKALKGGNADALKGVYTTRACTISQEICEYIKDLGVHNAFASAVSNILIQSEKIRHTARIRPFLLATYREGYYTGELIFLMLDKHHQTEGYSNFLGVISGVGNLSDTFFDMKRDYQNKEILIQPTLRNKYEVIAMCTKRLGFVLKHIARGPFMNAGLMQVKRELYKALGMTK